MNIRVNHPIPEGFQNLKILPHLAKLYYDGLHERIWVRDNRFFFLALALTPQRAGEAWKASFGRSGVVWSNEILLLAACGQSPESAGRELEQRRHVEYSETSFVDQAGKGDVWAVQLFLQAGMARM